MLISYTATRDWYCAGITLGTFMIPIAAGAVHRFILQKPSYALDTLILLFSTISYQLGACLDFYHRVPGFDKIAHFLSGTFAGILCVLLYCLLNPGKKLSKEHLPTLLFFVFFGSMAVAGLWEIGEYLLSKISLRDMQNVASTGVADTMQDMIVCLAGTLLLLPSVRKLALGRPTFLKNILSPLISD